MLARRDLLIGCACAATAGAAYTMEPRKRLVLLGDHKMADILPLKFDSWSAENSDGLVQPPDEGTLAAQLYSEMVGRIYHQTGTDAAVMMLVAYGDTQSDMLQLHRPEACYPAVGFTLASSRPEVLRISGGVTIPIREVVARLGDRQENIVYWARLGEDLPNSAGEQRKARLEASIRGFIPDGALIRFSSVGADQNADFASIKEFVRKLLMAVAPDQRRALIGTKRARELSA